VLVQAESARILVDAGPASARNTLRQLRAEGVNRLDALVLTHPDAQHIGAARWLMAEVPVRELWVPAHVWPSPAMKGALEQAEAAGIPVRRLRADDSGDWPGDLFWEVLWPPESIQASNADDASLALRVARHGVSILLAGDVGGEQERAMIDRGRSLAASVLLAGRHGDASATSGDWLEAVRPRDVVLSSGPHADGRHPDEEVLARLEARGIRIWRTDRQGTIHVEWDPAPVRWPAPGYRIRASPSTMR
jgi:competence protein ComEC